MTPTVYLFDIDGTILNSGGTGRRSIVRAFEELYGRTDAFDTVSFAGMTDRAIVRTGLQQISVRPTADEIDRALAHYVTVLREEVAAAPFYATHDGIREALEALHALDAPDRLAVGLGTGNVREGARVKLERLGLNDRFAFGGFGSDHEDRGELIRIGAEPGARQLGLPRENCRVVVIGDTPKDVAAARGIGAESVAVATGRYSQDELTASGATYACESLATPGAVETLLGRGHRP